ncbi:expressed unknown protein [Seminavis robusta]|uniref:DUF6824 domain-containing protein n=1 Tax=Seminavis robusta TaxID=568900 RepID=A0A9N8HKW4_9STRA|nr:expressed unknown protein [Seminavis robusta]|eukprot:Sro764_g199050.1 n/a (240) ;mRNA; f:22730-23583
MQAEDDETEEAAVLIDIAMLIMMTAEDEQRAQEQDDVSALTEFSLPLNDIRVPGRNDVIFRPDLYTIDRHSRHSGNRRFSRLIVDHKDLYRSNRKKEDRELVLTEVVRIWRSLDPPGRFLAQTESTQSAQQDTLPLVGTVYHDIGDEDARERTAKLLKGNYGRLANNKHRDDNTASTANSSTWLSSRAGGSAESSAEQAAVSTRLGRKTDCFGGSIRGCIMGFFAKRADKEGILNQYLP